MCADGARVTPIVRAIQRAEPAVVNIQGNKTVNADGVNSSESKGQTVNGMGTGVILDRRGYIVTNLHVVQDVSRIQVTLPDGTETRARLLKFDPVTDLALIKIDIAHDLPVIEVGSSDDLLRGETVIAIGNPYGYNDTVTVGIISALHRNVPVNGTQEYRDLIQTNADINPGNSGGPLVNIEGKMIGINVAVRVGAQGIGFAIPSNTALDVVADLVASIQEEDLSLGVELKSVKSNGQRYLEVVSSENARLDINAGDRIVSVEGAPVQHRLDLEFALLGRRSGEGLEIGLVRGGRPVEAEVQLASASGRSSVSDEIWERFGAFLESVPAATMSSLNSPYSGGLRVTKVKSGSIAAVRGLQVGDIIVGLMNRQTATTSDFHWVLKNEFRANQPKIHLLEMKSGTSAQGNPRHTR
jgi:serine protease Do